MKVCTECRSPEVYQPLRYWVNDGCTAPDGDIWCEDCGSPTTIDDEEEA